MTQWRAQAGSAADQGARRSASMRSIASVRDSRLRSRSTSMMASSERTRLQRSDYYRWIYDNKPAWQRA